MLEIGEQQGATDCCEFCKAAGAVEEGLAAAIKQQSRLASVGARTGGFPLSPQTMPVDSAPLMASSGCRTGG